MVHTNLCGERDNARVGEEMNGLCSLAMGKVWVNWVGLGYLGNPVIQFYGIYLLSRVPG